MKKPSCPSCSKTVERYRIITDRKIFGLGLPSVYCPHCGIRVKGSVRYLIISILISLCLALIVFLYIDKHLVAHTLVISSLIIGQVSKYFYVAENVV